MHAVEYIVCHCYSVPCFHFLDLGSWKQFIFNSIPVLLSHECLHNLSNDSSVRSFLQSKHGARPPIMSTNQTVKSFWVWIQLIEPEWDPMGTMEKYYKLTIQLESLHGRKKDDYKNVEFKGGLLCQRRGSLSI